MSTQREIIYTIKNIIRGGLITDDDKLSDRQVAFIIDNVRAILLRQQYDKGQSLSDNHIQPIPCLDLESVDTSFDTNFPLDCKVYKTIKELPKPIEARGKDLVLKVTAPEFGNIGYDLIPYNRLPYATHTPFKRPLAVLYNKYVYLVNAPYSKKVTVLGIWEKPNALSGYTTCDGSTCFNWDSPYPISAHLIDPLVKMCIDELSFALKVNQDKTNDSNQSLESQNKPQ